MNFIQRYFVRAAARHLDRKYRGAFVKIDGRGLTLFEIRFVRAEGRQVLAVFVHLRAGDGSREIVPASRVIWPFDEKVPTFSLPDEEEPAPPEPVKRRSGPRFELRVHAGFIPPGILIGVDPERKIRIVRVDEELPDMPDGTIWWCAKDTADYVQWDPRRHPKRPFNA